MINSTSEYDKFKALDRAINDANLQAHSQPIDQGVDLEALVLADWNKNMMVVMDELTRKALKRKASPRQAARRQRWFNEVRRVV